MVDPVLNMCRPASGTDLSIETPIAVFERLLPGNQYRGLFIRTL
jgi:hypothetical protein